MTHPSFLGAFCVLPTNGFSTKPLKVKLFTGGQKATEFPLLNWIVQWKARIGKPRVADFLGCPV